MMPPAPPGYERGAVPGTTFEELDPDRLQRFLQRRAAGAAAALPAEQLAARLGLVTISSGRPVPTVAGLVCFSPFAQLIHAEWGVAAVRVHGTHISDPLTQKEDLEGPLDELFAQAMAFVREHNLPLPISGGAAAEPQPEYPEAAVREALLNALVHRDFRLTGRVTLRIFDDRLELWSPGGLPAQISLDGVTEASGVSLPRNPVVAATARGLGLIEQIGRGVPTIRRLVAERTAQPCLFRSTPSDFLVVLPSPRSARAVPDGPGN